LALPPAPGGWHSRLYNDNDNANDAAPGKKRMMPSNFATTGALFGAGVAAGAINAFAGGGTIITFPALLLAGMNPIAANTTSTVALLPGALGGIAGYRRNIPAVLRWLRLFAGVSAAGGLLGGVLLTQTTPSFFKWLAPFLVLFATALFTAHGLFSRILRGRAPEMSRAANPRWLIGALSFQFAVAVYGGYFGAGIGILMLASLGILGFRHIHEMNTVKSVLGFLINAVAAVYFIWKGLVDWPIAALMAAGAVAGGYLGAHFAQKIPQPVVRGIITTIGVSISLALFLKK